MKLEELNIEYDKLQKKYGDSSLTSIYNGGCINNPDICFIFMNPTGRNIASNKEWEGIKSPWLGTKNIWKLFYNINLLNKDIYEKIINKKSSDWDCDFCLKVYNDVTEKNTLLLI